MIFKCNLLSFFKHDLEILTRGRLINFIQVQITTLHLFITDPFTRLNRVYHPFNINFKRYFTSLDHQLRISEFLPFYFWELLTLVRFLSSRLEVNLSHLRTILQAVQNILQRYLAMCGALYSYLRLLSI